MLDPINRLDLDGNKCAKWVHKWARPLYGNWVRYGLGLIKSAERRKAASDALLEIFASPIGPVALIGKALEQGMIDFGEAKIADNMARPPRLCSSRAA